MTPKQWLSACPLTTLDSVNGGVRRIHFSWDDPIAAAAAMIDPE
jgi:hypothetical protein